MDPTEPLNERIARIREGVLDADVYLAADPRWAMRTALAQDDVRWLCEEFRGGADPELLVQGIRELASQSVPPDERNSHEPALIGLLVIVIEVLPDLWSRAATEAMKAPQAPWVRRICGGMIAAQKDPES